MEIKIRSQKLEGKRRWRYVAVFNKSRDISRRKSKEKRGRWDDDRIYPGFEIRWKLKERGQIL